MKQFTKSLLVMLTALFSFSFAFAETGTETEPSAIPAKDAAIEGQCYTIAGTYNAGGGSTKAGNMTSKGFKCRTGNDGARVVFTVNPNYTITKFVGEGISNYVADDNEQPGVTVSKVEVDGTEVDFTSDGFPGKGATTSGNITIENIQATQSIAIYFDNSNSTAGTQINFCYALNWERPDATQPTIKVSPAEVTLVPGATYQLTTKVDPNSFTTNWVSELESVATVSETGLVTAVSNGVATIKNAWTDDATVYGAAQIYVSAFNPADYKVAKEYDFTTMGDVTLAIGETAVANIWNEGNNKINGVFFCTNEGLGDIAVQAVLNGSKGWSITEAGLTLGSGAGRCAAVGNLKADQIVEIIYTGSAFYTGSKNDAVRKDDGAAKTALNEGVGRAIYQMDEDGFLGFEIEKGKAIQKIIIYEEDVPESFIADGDFASLDSWTAVNTGQFFDQGNGLIGTYKVRDDQAAATIDEDHLATEYCIGLECRWSTNYAAYTQDVELPAGDYALVFDVENTNVQTQSANYENRFSVKVGESVYTDESTEWMRGKSEWNTHAIYFSLSETTTVTISLGYGTGNNNIGSANTPALYVSHLVLTEQIVITKAELEVAISESESLLNEATTEVGKSDLQAAIDAAKAKLTSTDAAEIRAAIDALLAAVNAYNDAIDIAENAALVAGATATNPVEAPFVKNGTFDDADLSDWTATGGFQNNTRKTTEDASADIMNNTLPWYENWTPNSSAGANKMYQVIKNIPNGTYKLSITAFANNVSELNEKIYVFANNDKTFLTAKAANYEVTTKVEDNTLEIGLEQTEAVANWMGIDNVSLLYYGTEEETKPIVTDLIEIPQDQGKDLDTFTRAELVEGEAYNTYTANADLTVAFKMFNIDVKDCDYVIVKFAEPVAAGWSLAFWGQNDQSTVSVPEGATEYKYVFAEDSKCAIENGVLPQITMLTLWGAQMPLVAKVSGIYKHTIYTDYTKFIVNADLKGEGGFDAAGTKGIDGSGIVKAANNAQFDFKQTIANLPAGKYKLTAQAAYRYSGSEADEAAAITAGTDTKLAKLYATVGGKTVETAVMNRYDGASTTDYAAGNGSVTVNEKYVPNSSSAVQAWFAAGQYVNEVVFNVAEAGDVTIGIVKTAQPEAGDYTVIGPWTLTRLGDAEDNALAEAIEALKAEIATAEALLADEYKTEGKADFQTAINTAKALLESTNIDEVNAGIETLKAAEQAFKVANYYIYDGVAYIIDAETGKFVAAGHDWGTRGIIANQGLDLTFKTNTETRKVTIDSRVSNGGDSHFLGSNLYMDAAAFEWILEYRGFGFYISNGTQYLNIDENDNLALSDQPREWIIVTDQGVKAQVLEEMAEATAEKPVDATFLIKASNFNRNDARNAEAWTVSEDCTNKNLSGGNNTNNCAESYHSTFTISQAIQGAPKGIYTLKAQGFYRQDDGETEEAPVFFANDSTAAIPVKTGTENSMSDASASFTNGLYAIEPIFVEVGEDGALTVGVKSTASHQWVIFDNFTLTYYGAATTIDRVKNIAFIKELETLREEMLPEDGIIAMQVEADAVLEAIAQVYEETENVNLDDIEAIKAAIEKLKAVKDRAEASAMVKEILPQMQILVESTNVYTEEALNEYYNQWLTKYEDGTLTKTEAATLQDPFLLTGWHASITADNFLLSAWDTNPDFQDAPYYINTWSTEGENDGSNFKVPFFEYWTGDGESLAERTLTATVNVPHANTRYMVTALVRVRAKNGYTAPAYGINLQVGEGVPVDVAAGDQIGESQYYLKEFSTTGKSNAEGKLFIKFNIAADNNISWLAFKNVNYEFAGDMEFKEFAETEVLRTTVENVEIENNKQVWLAGGEAEGNDVWTIDPTTDGEGIGQAASIKVKQGNDDMKFQTWVKGIDCVVAYAAGVENNGMLLITATESVAEGVEVAAPITKKEAVTANNTKRIRMDLDKTKAYVIDFTGVNENGGGAVVALHGVKFVVATDDLKAAWAASEVQVDRAYKMMSGDDYFNTVSKDEDFAEELEEALWMAEESLTLTNVETINTITTTLKELLDQLEEALGISDVKANMSSNRVYNLQGQKMNGMQKKGLYIIDGKKMIVK